MRPRRAFTVEQARRKEAMTPHVRCRRLALQALRLGGEALGELNGARPDPTGAARWSLIGFSDELANAPPMLPAALNTPDGLRAWAVLIACGRAFVAATPRGRRGFAPALIAAAQLVEDMFQEPRS
ncbi:hypothetical protein [Caulobacter sp. BP25]|uniref:hypothetical protein n=1 Tax=Caulobacter sp. BP25 TaxID=2048900 RepID=UPI000C12DEB3|nr:hypothetical protein [Caulobacter sp. BP25]PHY20913.1 hypothetical protein CSW59_06795 [Caulobacter sp. BP25]